MSSPLSLPTHQETHLWQLHLPDAHAYGASWQTWLSAAEHDRAQRFVQSADRDRFCFSRAGLRNLLSRYLGCAPAAIALRYGSHGKPELDLPHPHLHFNLAHSGNWVVYGISRHPWVGVDVEVYRDRSTLEGLIERCLTPAERAHLPTESPARSHAFCQYWAIKEAHLKAVGVGLSYAMHRLQVALSPDPHLVCPAQLPGVEGQDWSVTLWHPAPNAIAAACTGAAPHHFTRRSFPLPDSAIASASPATPTSE